MKPHWNKLTREFAPTGILIGEIDCTKQTNKEVCARENVRGYPTLKYWTNGETHLYSGRRSYEDFKNFVLATLPMGAICLISDLSTCSEQEIDYFIKMQKRGYGSISSQLKKLAVMKNKDMHGDVEIWLEQRLNILEQLDSANSKTEL